MSPEYSQAQYRVSENEASNIVTRDGCSHWRQEPLSQRTTYIGLISPCTRTIHLATIGHPLVGVKIAAKL